MAIAGHKTLSEVQPYNIAANKKRLADSAMAEIQGQKECERYKGRRLHKQSSKSLKKNG